MTLTNICSSCNKDLGTPHYLLNTKPHCAACTASAFRRRMALSPTVFLYLHPETNTLSDATGLVTFNIVASRTSPSNLSSTPTHYHYFYDGTQLWRALESRHGPTHPLTCRRLKARRGVPSITLPDNPPPA